MLRTAPIALFTVFALPLQAAPPTGELRFGLADTPAHEGATVFADFEWDLRFGSGGVAVGSYGLWTEDTHPHETYATLFVDLGDGRLSAGVPRPAYDQFAVAAVDHAFPSLGIRALPATRSHATAVAADGAGVPLGVMYRSGAGDLGWSASAHDIDRTDTQLLSLGTGYTGDGWHLDLALERVDGPDNHNTNAKLQAGADIGRAHFTASYFTAKAQDAPDLAELAAALPVSDRFRATFFTLLPPSDPEDTVLGAAARYDLTGHVVLDAAAAHGDGESWLGASIGWTF